MSIKAYPKHNFSVEINNDEPTCMLRFTPTVTGYLDSVRVKVINKNWDGSGKCKLRLRSAENGAVIAESAYLDYKDVKTVSDKYYYGLIKFTFVGSPIQSGQNYILCMTQENANQMGASSFFSYVVDHNFPVNVNIVGDVDPITNMRLSAELFFKGAYNDFI